MNTSDIISMIALLVSTVISIIALVQSRASRKVSDEANDLARNANQMAREANKIAEEAGQSQEKGYMPILVFEGEINVKKKDKLQIGNEITFDIGHVMEDSVDFDIDEYNCLCVKLRNIGEGILSAIEIHSILLAEGNHMTIYDSNEEHTTLLSYHSGNAPEHRCVQDAVLKLDDTVEINILLPNWADEIGSDNIYMVEINKLERSIDNENVILFIEVSTFSPNSTYYKQDSISGTYLEQKLTFASFGSANRILTEK